MTDHRSSGFRPKEGYRAIFLLHPAARIAAARTAADAAAVADLHAHRAALAAEGAFVGAAAALCGGGSTRQAARLLVQASGGAATVASPSRWRRRGP
jgi:hypothetical protein